MFALKKPVMMVAPAGPKWATIHEPFWMKLIGVSLGMMARRFMYWLYDAMMYWKVEGSFKGACVAPPPRRNEHDGR